MIIVVIFMSTYPGLPICISLFSLIFEGANDYILSESLKVAPLRGLGEPTISGSGITNQWYLQTDKHDQRRHRWREACQDQQRVVRLKNRTKHRIWEQIFKGSENGLLKAASHRTDSQPRAEVSKGSTWDATAEDMVSQVRVSSSTATMAFTSVESQC